MDPVDLPAFLPGAPLEELERDIDRWVHSDALSALVERSGGAQLNGDESLDETVEKLTEFSCRWDFRGGRERNLADLQEFANAHTDLVREAAYALGLIDPRSPLLDAYDHLLVLGGLIRACVLRPRLAAALVDDGLTTSTITAIGAFRPLGGDEPALARAAGLEGIVTEFDAMDAGMRRAFDLGAATGSRGGEDLDNQNLSWSVREYGQYGPSTVSVVAAPTTDTARRANTPDSYKYWAEKLVEPLWGQRVLLITSAIYVPFQHADAIRMLGLPYGLELHTVGVDTTSVRDPRLSQHFAPSQYLQEVRSAILSMRNLVVVLRKGAGAT